MEFAGLKRSLKVNENEEPSIYLAMCMMESIIEDIETVDGQEIQNADIGDETFSIKMSYICSTLSKILMEKEDDITRAKSRLQKKVKELEDQKAKLEGLTGVGKEIEALEKDIAALENKKQEIEKQKKLYDEKLREKEKLASQLATIQTVDLKSAEDGIAAVLQQIEDAKADIEQQKVRKAELEGELQNKRDELAQNLQTQEIELEKKREELKQIAAGNQAKVDQKKAELDQIAADNQAEFERGLAELDQVRADNQAVADQKKAELDRIAADNQAAYEEELKKLAQVAADNQAVVDQKKAELDQIAADHQAAYEEELKKLDQVAADNQAVVDQKKAELDQIAANNQAELDKKKAELDQIAADNQAEFEKGLAELDQVAADNQAAVDQKKAELDQIAADHQAAYEEELKKLDQVAADNQAVVDQKKAELDQIAADHQAELEAELEKLKQIAADNQAELEAYRNEHIVPIQATIDQHAADVEALKQEEAELEQQKQQAEAELEKQKQQAEADKQSAAEELDGIRQEYQGMLADLEQTRQSCVDEQEKINQLKENEIKTAETELAELQNATAVLAGQLEEKKAALKAAYEEQEEELIRQKGILDHQKKEQEDDLEEYRCQNLAPLEDEINALKEKTQVYTSQLETLKKERIDLISTIGFTEGEVKKWSTKKDEKAQELQIVESQRDDLHNQVEQLEKDYQTVTDEIAALQSSKFTLEQEAIPQAKTDRDSMKADKEAAQTEFTALVEDISQTETALEELKEKIAPLEEQKKTLDNSLKLLTAKYDSADKEITDLNARIEELRDKTDSQKLEQYKIQQQNTINELVRIQAECEALDAKIKECEDKIIQASQESVTLRNRKADAEATLKQNEEMLKNMADLKSEQYLKRVEKIKQDHKFLKETRDSIVNAINLFGSISGNEGYFKELLEKNRISDAMKQQFDIIESVLREDQKALTEFGNSFLNENH